MLTVGIFEIEPDPTLDGRWHVKNTITGFTHRTYGTQEELETEYKTQSDAWEKRVKESGGRLTARGKFGGGVVKKSA